MESYYRPENFSFNLIEQINITRNPNQQTWELIVCGPNFKAAHFGSWTSLDDVMGSIREFRYNCPNARILISDDEVFDNTCRVRKCKWNLNDTCSTRQHLSIVPAPAEPDLTKEEWTAENSIMPDVCPEYQIAE